MEFHAFVISVYGCRDWLESIEECSWPCKALLTSPDVVSLESFRVLEFDPCTSLSCATVSVFICARTRTLKRVHSTTILRAPRLNCRHLSGQVFYNIDLQLRGIQIKCGGSAFQSRCPTQWSVWKKICTDPHTSPSSLTGVRLFTAPLIPQANFTLINL